MKNERINNVDDLRSWLHGECCVWASVKISTGTTIFAPVDKEALLHELAAYPAGLRLDQAYLVKTGQAVDVYLG